VRAAELRAAFAALLSQYGIQHLVHVGAHEGEEVPYYVEAGVQRITLVEPHPKLAAKLRERWPDCEVVEAACSDEAGSATLHVPMRTNMATLLDGLEGVIGVEVQTVRLDEIAPDADGAVIDVQGHELVVLSAAPWDSLRLLMIETCTVDDPTLAPPYDTVVAYMAERGFVEAARLIRDYDWIQRWAYGRKTDTGAEVRDVVFAREAQEV
jgi:FkbM family methyltransferase